MKSTVLIFALLLTTFAAFGQQQHQDLPILAGDSPVGPGDVIDIRVLEDPTMNGQTSVGDDGQITINVLGKVQVAGLTASQIEIKLRTLLEANILTKATV